ncbi:MAG: ABC transporter permease [Bacteroidales bacterium]|nr:ABC transporter permease [Bacteroidales bacterium]MCF8405133.1 ABC transporter permease [Bacteroidales bacterium]
MFRSYLRSLYRNTLRNKFYTFLNVIGLSIGLTIALYILIYVKDEIRYDKQYLNYKRIYRLEASFNVNNNLSSYAIAPLPLGPALKAEIPEIAEVVRLDHISESLFRYGDNEYFESDFYMADSSLFDVFDHPFLNGNPDRSLTEPNSIILTRNTAERYFANENPLGKIIKGDLDESYKVTGVIENLPGNTHLKFDALISISTEAEKYSTTKPSRFWRVGAFTFILLNENSQIETVKEKFLDFYQSKMEPLGKQFGVSFELEMTPLADTHFRQGLRGELPNGNRVYTLIFSAIAAFVLLLAAINYMNMATARSANRAKEVGLRKVVGAEKSQLIKQFLGESLVLSFIGMLLSIIIAYLFLNHFNTLSGKEVSLAFSENPEIFGLLVLVTLITGFLAGSYPAFYLSSFRPMEVLKGRASSSGGSSILLRKILVVMQFFIAILMIISSITVNRQIKFLQKKDLGFSRDNILIFGMNDDLTTDRQNAFKRELLARPGIIEASISSGIPGNIVWTNNLRVEQEEGMEDRALIINQTDYSFNHLYELEFIQGRDFDESMGTDIMEACIINESAAYKLGWIENPLGKSIHYGYGQDGIGGKIMKVIGVVKDFHFSSLHNPIEPLVIFITDDQQYFLSVKFNPQLQGEAIQWMEEKWNSFGLKYPFKYEFLTDRLDEMYVAEKKIGSIIGISTLLTILIALLGLLGLSSFVAEQKMKEIGVRKIHGASVLNILTILYRDYFILFFIAFVLAVPIAWWQLSGWLDTNFVFATSLHWSIFLVAGLSSFITGMLVMGYYIIRASLGNPIDAIKCE